MTREEELEGVVDALQAENVALRAGISAIHRRAQRSEGASARFDRAKAGYERELARIQEQAKIDEQGWRDEADRLRVETIAMLRWRRDASLWARFVDWAWCRR